MDEPVEHEPTEISYDEQRYPARPRRLRPRDQLRSGSLRRFTADPHTASGTNPAYVEWLVRQSMLKDADVLSRTLSGQPSMWQNPYARPDARRALETGAINAAVPHADLEKVAYEWAEEILGKSPTAIRMLKFAFNAVDDGLVGQQVFAGEATRLAYGTDEAVEGRDAFLEKRDPDWGPYPWQY